MNPSSSSASPPGSIGDGWPRAKSPNGSSSVNWPPGTVCPRRAGGGVQQGGRWASTGTPPGTARCGPEPRQEEGMEAALRRGGPVGTGPVSRAVLPRVGREVTASWRTGLEWCWGTTRHAARLARACCGAPDSAHPADFLLRNGSAGPATWSVQGYPCVWCSCFDPQELLVISSTTWATAPSARTPHPFVLGPCSLLGFFSCTCKLSLTDSFC